MKLSKARKILGKQAYKLSDENLQKEVETANMLAEIVLKAYKEKRISLK